MDDFTGDILNALNDIQKNYLLEKKQVYIYVNKILDDDNNNILWNIENKIEIECDVDDINSFCNDVCKYYNNIWIKMSNIKIEPNKKKWYILLSYLSQEIIDNHYF